MKKVDKIFTTWIVQHDTLMKDVALTMHLYCQYTQNLTESIIPKDMTLPVKPPMLEECQLCHKIENGNWLQFCQCSHMTHVICYNKVCC